MTLETQVKATHEIAFFRQRACNVLRVLFLGGGKGNIVGTDAGATQHERAYNSARSCSLRFAIAK